VEKEERRQLEKAEAVEKRRRQILDAGKKLFSEMSPGLVTMAAIGRECALSPGTIYLYFVSKEDLLFHIMTEYLSDVISSFSTDENLSGFEALTNLQSEVKMTYMDNLPMKNLVANFDLFYEETYPDLPIVNQFEKMAQELNRKLENLIIKGINDKSIRSDINARLYGCLIGNLASVFGSRTALRRSILTRVQGVDPFEEFSLVLELILKDLKSDQGEI